MAERRNEHAEGRGVMGNLLREARMQAGVGQSELGRRTNTSQALISDYERGVKEPSHPMMVRLLSGMNMTVEVGFKQLYPLV